MKKTITSSTAEAVELGNIYRQRLVEGIKGILNHDSNIRYPHLYVYSPPGLGKTFVSTKLLDESGVKYLKVSGNTSMFAFGISLAVIRFLNPNEKTVILVDDCDELFKDEMNCNIMKNVLDGLRCFKYEKSLQSQWSNLSDIQRAAIEIHQTEGQMGFTVPTDNIQFIINSNFRLPTDDETMLAHEKGGSRNMLKVHRNAIRSRCRVIDIELNSDGHFGWIAEVVQNQSGLNDFELNNDQIQEVLDFNRVNWAHLKERSIRSVQKMADLMVKYPYHYRELWTIEYLKSGAICN